MALVKLNGVDAESLSKVVGVSSESISKIGGTELSSPYENLTTFSVTDEDSDFTVTAGKASWSTMRRDANSYIYKDYGVDYFKNFVIEFEHKTDSIQSNSGGHIICLSDTVGTQQDHITATDGSACWAYGSGSGVTLTFLLKDHSGSDSADTFPDGGSSSNLLYGRFTKTANVLILDFFSDSDRTTLVDRMKYYDAQPTGTHRYLSVVGNRDSASDPAEVWTGYTQNVEIVTTDYDGGGSYEDLSSFTESDASARLHPYNTTCVIDDLQQGDDAIYLYKDYTASYFDDYDIEFTAEMFKTGSSSAHIILWAVSDTVGDFNDFNTANDGIIVDFYRGTTSTNFRLRDFSNDNQDTYTGLGNVLLWGPLYFKVERTGTTATCKIYDDADRTSLVDTLSITSETAAKRYMYAAGCRGGATTDKLTGYTRDFEIITAS